MTNKSYKIALGIEYNGSAYHGWQKQKNLPTIQKYLEYALSEIANESIKIYCGGRTDTGVHAYCQVIHFETNASRSNKAWTIGVNNKLPNDIVVKWIIPVKFNFHARFSAISRRYIYCIYNDKIRSALNYKKIMHVYYPLDIKKMIRASRYLIGENDFTTFRSINCQSHTSWRNIHYINILNYYNYIIIDIKANSFLYHMVRNIVGSLIDVGCGKNHETWIYKLLLSRNNKLISRIAPAYGLYLLEIEYPKYFLIPKINNNFFINSFKKSYLNI